MRSEGSLSCSVGRFTRDREIYEALRPRSRRLSRTRVGRLGIGLTILASGRRARLGEFHALDGNAVHQSPMAGIIIHRFVPRRPIVPDRNRAGLPAHPSSECHILAVIDPRNAETVVAQEFFTKPVQVGQFPDVFVVGS